MALSKKDLQINITLNELYNTHSLLMQHMDVLVDAFLIHLFLADVSSSPHMTSTIFASFLRSLVLLLPKSRGRRTDLYRFLCIHDGRRRYRTYRPHSCLTA